MFPRKQRLNKRRRDEKKRASLDEAAGSIAEGPGSPSSRSLRISIPLSKLESFWNKKTRSPEGPKALFTQVVDGGELDRVDGSPSREGPEALSSQIVMDGALDKVDGSPSREGPEALSSRVEDSDRRVVLVEDRMAGSSLTEGPGPILSPKGDQDAYMEDWFDPSIEMGDLDLVDSRVFELEDTEVVVNVVAERPFSMERYLWLPTDPPDHFMEDSEAEEESFTMDRWPFTEKR